MSSAGMPEHCRSLQLPGEIRPGEGKFQEALDCYDKALDYSRNQEAYSSWVVFSCNAGVTCYNMGQFARARKYFLQAL